MGNKVGIMLVEMNNDTADMVAKLAIASLLAFSEENPRKKEFNDMTKAVIEFFEQIMDPSVKSVGLYLELQKLLPEGMVRKPPQHIEEFILKMKTGRL